MDHRKINPGHDHPRLPAPVPREVVVAELHGLMRQAGYPSFPTVSWPNTLTAQHDRRPRRYAQTFVGAGDPRVGGRGEPRFELAEQIRYLPQPQRIGVLAHELGHMFVGGGTEAQADQAAEAVLGIPIVYDRRWPGKGLQADGRYFQANPPPGPEEAPPRFLVYGGQDEPTVYQVQKVVASVWKKGPKRYNWHLAILLDRPIMGSTDDYYYRDGGVAGPRRLDAINAVRSRIEDHLGRVPGMATLRIERGDNKPFPPVPAPKSRRRRNPSFGSKVRSVSGRDTDSSTAFGWLSEDTLAKWLPLARQRGLSEVARGPGGFVRAYRRAGGDRRRLSERWIRKRNGFVKRHMAQAIQGGEQLYGPDGLPTNRHLILIMWAYSPDPARVRRGPRGRNPIAAQFGRDQAPVQVHGPSYPGTVNYWDVTFEGEGEVGTVPAVDLYTPGGARWKDPAPARAMPAWANPYSPDELDAKYREMSQGTEGYDHFTPSSYADMAVQDTLLTQVLEEIDDATMQGESEPGVSVRRVKDAIGGSFTGIRKAVKALLKDNLIAKAKVNPAMLGYPRGTVLYHSTRRGHEWRVILHRQKNLQGSEDAVEAEIRRIEAGLVRGTEPKEDTSFDPEGFDPGGFDPTSFDPAVLEAPRQYDYRTMPNGPYYQIQAYDVSRDLGGEEQLVAELVLLKGSGEDRTFGTYGPKDYLAVTQLWRLPTLADPEGVTRRLYELAHSLAMNTTGRTIASSIHRMGPQEEFWGRQRQAGYATLASHYGPSGYVANRWVLSPGAPQALANPRGLSYARSLEPSVGPQLRHLR